MGGRDGNTRGADDRCTGAVGAPAEPPGGANATETDRNGDKAGSAKGRGAEEGLYGRKQSHQERRVVVPPGIEMTLPHPPGARDDARLIRVEDRERQSVTAADETEEGGEHEDHREGDPRIQ